MHLATLPAPPSAPDYARAATAGRRVAVKLGSGQRVPLATYCAAWRACRTAPPGQPVRGSLCDPFTARAMSTAGQELAEFRRGMHDRINRHLAAFGRGRKWSGQWQADAARTARDVNTPRLIVRWVPVEFRARVAARLADAP